MSYKLVGSIDRKTGLIDPKSHISKISKRRKAITYLFEAQIASCSFPVFKGHYKLTLGGVLRVF